MNLAAAEPILSRPVLFDSVPEEGIIVDLAASPAERDVVRLLNGLVAISDLHASFTLRREGRSGVWVVGEVVATVVQTCVVSLDHFEAEVREPVSVHFLQPDALDRWRVRRAAAPSEAGDLEIDEPDPIEGGRIDLGVIASEFLSLGLDPYPKKPGVRLEDVVSASADSGREASPFAALKALRSSDV